jgi:hypothetical protein
MKKLLIIILSAAVFSSCNNKNAKTDSQTVSKTDSTTDSTSAVKNISLKTFDLKIGGKTYLMERVPNDLIDFGETETKAKARTAACDHPEHCTTAEFAGCDRRDAKTSIYAGNTKNYNTIDELLGDVLKNSDAKMRSLIPPITEDPNSERTKYEDRYVVVQKAFIYGIYRESDNDFHIIVGNGLTGDNMKLINVECSGLPADGSGDRGALNDVRNMIMEKFGDLRCGDGADKPVAEPISVSIEGSLFYDIDHAPTVVGFTYKGIDYHPKTSWEIHPLAKIVFN